MAAASRARKVGKIAVEVGVVGTGNVSLEPGAFACGRVGQIEAAVDLVAMTWLGSLPALNDEDRIVGQVRDWIVRHLGQMIVYGDHADNDVPYIPSVTKGIRHKRWVLLTETDFHLLSVTSSLSGTINLSSGAATLARKGNETWTVRLSFDPVNLGALSDGLQISSDDPDEAVTTVALTGIGQRAQDIQALDSVAPSTDLRLDFGGTPQ